MNPRSSTKRRLTEPVGPARVALVVSRSTSRITRRLLEGAVECLRAHGVPDRNARVFVCPGAFELPQAANRLAAQRSWDAIVCLAAFVRGETPPFDGVSAETARGIQDVALRHGLPVIFGVLTANTERQALDRSGGRHGNNGWDAAVAAIEMIALFRSLGRRRPGRPAR